MSGENTKQRPTQPTVTIDDVNRILEVGRLLLSVLTPEELEELQALLSSEPVAKPEIGNMGVT